MFKKPYFKSSKIFPEYFFLQVVWQLHLPYYLLVVSLFSDFAGTFY